MEQARKINPGSCARNLAHGTRVFILCFLKSLLMRADRKKRGQKPYVPQSHSYLYR